MAKTLVYNIQGEKAGELELADAIFQVDIQPELVQFVARLQRANAHVPYAHAKGRRDVSGGGRKPWRQKGTGNARHGSIRSPLWRGGGATFGPSKLRNMKKKVNKKEKQAAIRMVLSDKLAHNALAVVDGVDALTGKTSEIAQLLEKLPTGDTSVLIATGEKNEMMTRAAKNLQKVNTTLAESLNVGDLLKYQYLVLDKAAVEAIVKRFQ